MSQIILKIREATDNHYYKNEMMRLLTRKDREINQN